jgi:hypothetical protein
MRSFAVTFRFVLGALLGRGRAAPRPAMAMETAKTVTRVGRLRRRVPGR